MLGTGKADAAVGTCLAQQDQIGGCDAAAHELHDLPASKPAQETALYKDPCVSGIAAGPEATFPSNDQSSRACEQSTRLPAAFPKVSSVSEGLAAAAFQSSSHPAWAHDRGAEKLQGLDVSSVPDGLDATASAPHDRLLNATSDAAPLPQECPLSDSFSEPQAAALRRHGLEIAGAAAAHQQTALQSASEEGSTTALPLLLAQHTPEPSTASPMDGQPRGLVRPITNWDASCFPNHAHTADAVLGTWSQPPCAALQLFGTGASAYPGQSAGDVTAMAGSLPWEVLQPPSVGSLLESLPGLSLAEFSSQHAIRSKSELFGPFDFSTAGMAPPSSMSFSDGRGLHTGAAAPGWSGHEANSPQHHACSGASGQYDWSGAGAPGAGGHQTLQACHLGSYMSNAAASYGHAAPEGVPASLSSSAAMHAGQHWASLCPCGSETPATATTSRAHGAEQGAWHQGTSTCGPHNSDSRTPQAGAAALPGSALPPAALSGASGVPAAAVQSEAPVLPRSFLDGPMLWSDRALMQPYVPAARSHLPQRLHVPYHLASHQSMTPSTAATCPKPPIGAGAGASSVSSLPVLRGADSRHPQDVISRNDWLLQQEKQSAWQQRISRLGADGAPAEAGAYGSLPDVDAHQLPSALQLCSLGDEAVSTSSWDRPSAAAALIDATIKALADRA